MLEGGGGTRYFSGSRNDGYACSVCHGTVVDGGFAIEGLPRTVVPGQHYQITVRWTQPELPHGVHVEIEPRWQPRPGDDLASGDAARGVALRQPDDRRARSLRDRSRRPSHRRCRALRCGGDLNRLHRGRGSDTNWPSPGSRAIATISRRGAASEERIVIGATVEVPSGCATGGTPAWGCSSSRSHSSRDAEQHGEFGGPHVIESHERQVVTRETVLRRPQLQTRTQPSDSRRCMTPRPSSLASNAASLRSRVTKPSTSSRVK